MASYALREAGVTCHEYTLTTEGALSALVAARAGLEGVLLGVGSVRTVDDLRAAADAGADFAVA
jgi:2-dehydro-3-deoxyphosphogluconate aldolase / (4S)-4-hydroxy-2-oxoglutarate aldolase